MRNIGRTDACKDEAAAQAVISRLMSLPLLPAGDILQGFFSDMMTILSDDCPKTALKQPIRSLNPAQDHHKG